MSLPQWLATPTAFGTNAAAVTALKAQVMAARTAYTNAQAAGDASKSATTTENMAVATMLTGGRAMVNSMKSFIEASGNTALWGQAGLEPNAAPGTTPDPTAPYQLSATLDAQRDVILKWKTSQPQGVSGVIYSIRRALDGVDYVLLDSVGGKTFTDETVPVGTQSISYTIKAKRGTQTSNWSDALTLRFARLGGGLAITASETGPVSAQIAA